MTDDFANNPFKALKSAGLKLKDADAKDEKAGGARRGARRGRPAPAPAPPKAQAPAPGSPGAPDAFRTEDALFLRAMGAVGRKAQAPPPDARPRPRDERPFGDLLEEHEQREAAGARTGTPPASAPGPRPSGRKAARPPAPPAAPADPQDAALFLGAVGDVDRLDGGGGRDVPKAVEPPAPQAPAARPEALAREHLRRLVRGEVDFQLEFTDEYQHGHVTGLDPKIFNKLRAGAFSVEAHQDLHGLNAEQALYATVDFIRRNYLLGRRTLLLVTGRGRNSPDGRGVLRDEVQLWLTREPLRRVVLAFVTAQPRDGGPGALYVMLRKYRKSLGKVQWDRLPADWDA